MPVKKQKRGKKRHTRRQLLIYFLLLLIGLPLTLSMIRQWQLIRSNAQEGRIIMLYPNPEAAHSNLQLRTFPYIVIPPKPTSPPESVQPPGDKPPAGGACPLDYLKSPGETCHCIDIQSVACPAGGPGGCQGRGIPMSLPLFGGKPYCVTIGKTDPPPGCFQACIGKPVVYLYPEKTTSLDVSVTAPGDIIASDPYYPTGGWKGVEAHPDGTLYYEGKKYPELFYETAVKKAIPMPETGLVISVNDLPSRLSDVLSRLGLKENERAEFLEYWVPLLKSQKAPYVFFSVLSPEVKDSVDRLNITQEPDTRIEIIAYFKALQKPVEVKPLVLPETPPERKGFTAVEWGGTIGY